MPICLKYHPQTTPQQQSAIIDQGAFPPNSISNIYPTKMRFFSFSFLDLYDNSMARIQFCRRWQWATSNGHEFLRRRGDDILFWHATTHLSLQLFNLQNCSACKSSTIPRTPFPWEEAPLKMSKWQGWLRRTDLCLSILVETDLRQIFSGDRFETDFRHSALLRGQISLLCSTLNSSGKFITIACKPYVWGFILWWSSITEFVYFWNRSKC